MEFVTGRPVSLDGISFDGFTKSGKARFKGLPPAAARRRLVQLRWRAEEPGEAIAGPGKHLTKLPVLDTTAAVDTRAERYTNQGGPGDREMIATWTEGGTVIELQASVADLAGMEQRLGWVTKVDSGTWLDALPAKVVKAADHQATAREMLKGIPLPRTFAVSRIPDEGLTTSRERGVPGPP